MKGALVETPSTVQGEGGLQEDRANKKDNGLQNHLDLRLGISFNNGVENMVTSSTGISDGKGGGGGGSGSQSPCFRWATPDGLALNQRKRWFSETGGGGFVDPWSLAGRQEKAVLEQAHQKLKSSSFLSRASHPPPPPPPVVGWPPVRSFRKNLTASQPPKIEGEEEEEEEESKNKGKKVEGESTSHKVEARPTNYVKVNMDGFAVGRKIDLKAHGSYDSLSLALQKMFHNFLCANDSKKLEKEKGEESAKPGYILLYRDNEGDCLLVGDVPWEMFLTSVKRLYIVPDPRTPKEADRRMVE